MFLKVSSSDPYHGISIGPNDQVPWLTENHPSFLNHLFQCFDHRICHLLSILLFLTLTHFSLIESLSKSTRLWISLTTIFQTLKTSRNSLLRPHLAQPHKSICKLPPFQYTVCKYFIILNILMECVIFSSPYNEKFIELH